MAHVVAYPGGGRRSGGPTAEWIFSAITVPCGPLGRRDAGRSHPWAGTARRLDGRPVTSLSPAALGSSRPSVMVGTDPTMDKVQVKKHAKPVTDRNSDIYW